MSKRMGVVPAIAAAVIAALMAFGTRARSADECLAEPNRDPPDTRHWYYRIDRANNRKCWHLGEAVAQRPSPEPPPPPGPTTDRSKPIETTAIGRAERDALFREFIRWNELQRNFR